MTMAAPTTQAARNIADRIDPARAPAALERWRRAVAEAMGGDPGAPLDQPDRRLLMLRVFGATRRLAELCMTHPDAAAAALIDGASPVLAEAARDLTALDRGVGGPDALHAALAPLKNRVDLAIAIAEMSGQWSVANATAARVDFAERIAETALRWLVRAAVKRGELHVEDSENFLKGVFVAAGGDFAHEDMSPYGPLDMIILYDEKAFGGPSARGADRIFVRIGAEIREALEGKPGEYPLYALKTPLGSGVGGAGYADSVARVKATAAGPQADALKMWLGSARIIAGDRACGGAFLEDIEQVVWADNPISIEALRGFIEKTDADPRGPFRRVAGLCRLAIGGHRPIFRIASAREIFDTASRSQSLSKDAARRLVAGDELAQIVVSRLQMMKGAAVSGVERDDEQRALAILCGFCDYKDLEAALTGARTDARNTLRRLATGPQQEISLYRSGGDAKGGDADRLEDLGFLNGASLSAAVDNWAQRAEGPAADKRFSAHAPGLLTAFGETQHPNDAVRLFDRLLDVADKKHNVFALVCEDAPQRGGLVDAFGSFGAVVEPLMESAETAEIFFEAPGSEMPQTGKEWLGRHAPPPAKGKTALADLAHWRRDLMARIAYSAATSATSFDAAVEAFEDIHVRTLANTFDIALSASTGAEKTAASKIALHVFESDGPHLPGAATHLGFIAGSAAGEGGEAFVQRYLAMLGELGEGVFAVTPDASHRPGGVTGAVAPDIASFKSYVQSEAVAHEQIMLARGRVIASGDDKVADAARDALRGAVAGARRADILFRDLDRARAQRMRRERAGSEWDIDRLEGGRADVELVISTLIYKHASAHPFVQEKSPGEALVAMARSGLISEETAQSLRNARAFWARLQLVRALSGWSDPLHAPVRRRFGSMIARAAGVQKFDQVRPIMRGYAEEVTRSYAQIVLGRPSLTVAAHAAG
jgi:[glutamine synthetase] adenylyltransferase / [glutamine synthetase]-adenylyl-L-tyrosine phosphorylase